MKLLLLALALMPVQAAAADRCPRSHGEPGFAQFTIKKYYECVRQAAVQLEPSGEDAKTVASAAENQCPMQFEVVIGSFDECYGRGAGESLADEIRSRAISFGTAEVVKLRASRP